MDPNIDNLYSTLDSFIGNGPLIRLVTTSVPKFSYLSRQPAVYYSTSLVYGRLWPKLKKEFADYRRIESIGTEYSLIAVSKTPGDVFNGKIDGVTCGRINQRDTNLAKNASSSVRPSLIFKQFANRNLSHKPGSSTARKPIEKSDPSTAYAHIITSPLPLFEQDHLLGCDIDQALDSVTPIKDISMVAGCTFTGAKYLSAGVQHYIIYGFGHGAMGYGYGENDWGSAFCVAPFVADTRRAAPMQTS